MSDHNLKFPKKDDLAVKDRWTTTHHPSNSPSAIFYSLINSFVHSFIHSFDNSLIR